MWILLLAWGGVLLGGGFLESLITVGCGVAIRISGALWECGPGGCYGRSHIYPDPQKEVRGTYNWLSTCTYKPIVALLRGLISG